MHDLAMRNGQMTDLIDMLKRQAAHSLDVVIPARNLTSQRGFIRVSGVEPVVTDDGVTDPNGPYRPTMVFDQNLSEKFKIPLSYVRYLRDTRGDILDDNVNGWIHGRRPLFRGGEEVRPGIEGDGRSFLLRTFLDTDGGPGIARCLLSSSYRPMDNYDVLLATLDGVNSAGVEVEIAGCDLTERRMRVRIACPEVAVDGGVLVEGYEFAGRLATEYPLVWAGFELANSEVGEGAFTIVPRMTFQICDNGATITKDAIRQVHLGSRMADGIVRWADDTERKNLDLIKAKTRDAVRAFLDKDYLTRAVREAQEAAGVRVTDAAGTVEVVAKRMSYSEAESKAILAAFFDSGQRTAAGVFNAVTAVAQFLPDAERAAELESGALQALEIAAKASA